MRSVLIQFDYVYNDQDSIWVRPGYAGIAYSDGDEVEQRIASIINNASDLSILSDDLRQHCTDWPSLYHLSGTRANILRPFEPDLRGDILEIGAGCGAITRYLGECGGNVLALEGSPRRAAIARARTRDLKNVVVVCDKFDQFQCDKRFDVVTLIGVLEYANLFSAAENPTLAMLKRARSFLKPNGKLIIAIENKLGLKYFAGAPEDHVGIPMYGIEGRYRNDQPNTFGGRELSDLIEKAGFSTVKFLAPFPDYKLPVSIVTERGFSSDAFDSAALAWQSVRQDRQLPPIMAFSPELVWPSITNNGLALDLANSFLIVASPDERGNLVPSGTLAWHFTTDRRKVFCKNAEFVQVEANQVEVRYNRLDPAAPNPVVGSILQHYIPERAEYRHGRVLSYELMRVVMRDGWRNEEVCTLLRDWLNFIATLAAAQGKLIDLSAQLPGSFFDCIPQNIITSDDGGFHVIDTEWATKEKLEVGYIVFRALWALIYSVTRFGRSAENVSTTYLGFVLSVMNGLGWSISDEAIATYVTLESEIQAEVSGRVIDLQDVMNWLKNAVMPMSNLNQAVTERDGQVASLNQAVTERDGQVASLNQAVAERDGQIASLHQAVAERDGQIASLNQVVTDRGEEIARLNAELKEIQTKVGTVLQSISWKLTLPLREARRWVMQPGFQVRRYIEAGLGIARQGYQSLPLSYQARVKHRTLLARRFPKLLVLSGAHHGIPAVPADSVNPWREVLSDVSRFKANVSAAVALPTFTNPLVSVIIPVYGKIEYTLCCLDSIARNLPVTPFEVIVIDDHSPDNSAVVLGKVVGIRLIRNAENEGFIRSCNIGAESAQGQYVHFLNNDTQVTPGWLDELLRTFDEFPGTGLTGSRLVYPDGRLQEAGGIIWQDASAWNFGRLQNPSLPVYSYAREVDYCSGASIMVPKGLFAELGGFDEHYRPAYCEDSDLAMKIRSKGHRVIYQPLSTVIHYEGMTCGTDTTQGVKGYQIENTQKFFKRWQEKLKTHQAPGTDVDDAKDRRAKHRVLVLDHCTPMPDQDAGSVTVFNLLVLLRELNFQVTFIPEDNFLYMPGYTTALQRVGVEVLYAPYCTTIKQHLKEFGQRYDLVFLFRPVVVERNIQAIRKYCRKAKILYHTIDLHFLRMQREAAIQNDETKNKQVSEMRQREMAAIRSVDASIVHSTAELELLRSELPEEKIHVFPLIMDVRGTRNGFKDRRDIVFVGGYHHPPNVDAVKFMVGSIMPLLRRRLAYIKFYIVGSNPPDDINRLASEDVIITGYVEDLNSLLDKVRVSVAPLRYGAGIKGKIGTAMAGGLPVVATSLATEGMSLATGENILVADGAEAFADAVVRLYEDETLWNQLSKAGLVFADRVWGAEAALKTLTGILNSVGMSPASGPYPLSLYRGQSSPISFSDRLADPDYKKVRPGPNSNYDQKIERELAMYEKQEKVHDLPNIYHYWSNKFLTPILAEAGFQSVESFFVENLLEAKRRTGRSSVYFASIGAGNCDLEVNVAKHLTSSGCHDFVLECVEINPAMLDRGRKLAFEHNVSANIKFVEADFNAWRASRKYDAVIANQSLHHVTELEHLYDQIRAALHEKGSFVISDMIGRNGHQRWPESLEVVHRFWKELPYNYKFNVLLKRHEEVYENWDCSREGFEGVRAQEVLPLLLDRFKCETFIGFGSAIDIFVDRCFGHNFDPSVEWDRTFIDRVHAEDEMGLLQGKLTPTHMMAVFVVELSVPTFCSRGLCPEKAVREAQRMW